MGGKDFASSRYVYTIMSKTLRNLFKEEDDPILTHVNDDGY